jgi:hypothetical protein
MCYQVNIEPSYENDGNRSFYHRLIGYSLAALVVATDIIATATVLTLVILPLKVRYPEKDMK